VSAVIEDGFVHVVMPTEHLQAVDTIVKLTFDRALRFAGDV